MKGSKRIKWLQLVGIVVFVLAALLAVKLLWPHPTFGRKIQKDYEATLLVPKHETVTILPKTASYDNQEKLLSYHVRIDGIDTVVSEQPTPEQFVDFPDLYDKLVNGMSRYKSIEFALGTAYLTRPASLDGKQAGTMNEKGTLLFAKPEKDLSEKQWGLFFRSLEIEK